MTSLRDQVEGTANQSTQRCLLVDLPAIEVGSLKGPTKNLYRDCIKDIIAQRTSLLQPTQVIRLDLVVPNNGYAHLPRSQLFNDFQAMIADVYTLACSAATTLEIDLDFPGGFDLRVYALDSDAAGEMVGGGPAHTDSGADAVSGPLTTLAAFQSSVSDSNFDLNRLLGSRNTLSSKSGLKPEAGVTVITTEQKPHTRVAVGGTFDHLHVGHKLLLTATIFTAQPGPTDREITIGITGDELLVNKKHASVLESWDVRQQRSADFVESILIFHSDISSIRTVQHIDVPGPNGKVVKVTYDTGTTGKVTLNYVRISDPFGPTITDESITALVISAETRAGGQAVNDKRLEKGWEALEVFEVSVLDPSAARDSTLAQNKAVPDFTTKISSTEIRRRLAATQTA